MIIRIVLILLATVSVSNAKEWRGIVPLHSTRLDVERLLGPPSIDRSDTMSYELEAQRVSFYFASGPCGTDSTGWNVPIDTVISIWITPKANMLKMADLKLDERKYKRVRDDHVWHIINFVSDDEGISYQVDSSHHDAVTLIKYTPARNDDHLRCPSSGERLENTTKYYSYSDIPFASEKKLLESFAEQVRRYEYTQAYILVYASRRASTGEANNRAKRAREYLISELGIDARRIVTIDGGRQEEVKVELYLVPPGAFPPPSVPTVDPGEVQLFTTTSARIGNCRSSQQRRKVHHWCQ